MRPGDKTPFIDHAPGCDGTEYSACRPVVIPKARSNPPADVEVVYMEWCGECGGADWETV